MNPVAEGVAMSSAVNWLKGSAGSREIGVSDVREVFATASGKPCNLVSVIGRARAGKSFLLNCIAGVDELFETSNGTFPCTKGVNISRKLFGLGELEGGCVDDAQINVGFIDVEGQGDKDISHDANLICPILLTSKCVIFNWKGDLQKDLILDNLSIMARAAMSIARENGVQQVEVFNHLHIVIRDWQCDGEDTARASDLSERDVLSILFPAVHEQSSAGHAARNIKRQQIASAFASIRVWLLPPPTERTADLKKILRSSDTCSNFQKLVQKLRFALCEQLREPSLLAGHLLTGGTIPPLMYHIVAALNRGNTVLPSSVYLTMVQQELQQIVAQYRSDITEGANCLAAVLDDLFSTATGSEWIDPRQAVVTEQFTSMVASVRAQHSSRLNRLIHSSDTRTHACANDSNTNFLSGMSVNDEFEQLVREINVPLERSLEQATSRNYSRWYDAYSNRKADALDKAEREGAEVVSAILSAALDEDDVQEPFDVIAQATAEQVRRAVMSSVSEWLLHLTSDYVGTVEMETAIENLNINFVVRNTSYPELVKEQLFTEAKFLNSLNSSLIKECEAFRSLWFERFAEPLPTTETNLNAVSVHTRGDGTCEASLSDIAPELTSAAIANRSIFTRLTASIDAQRERARKWAQEHLGLTIQKSSKSSESVKMNPSGDSPVPRRKTFIEQKRDALRYAMEQFGWATVAEIPPDSDADSDSVETNAVNDVGREMEDMVERRERKKSNNAPVSARLIDESGVAFDSTNSRSGKTNSDGERFLHSSARPVTPDLPDSDTESECDISMSGDRPPSLPLKSEAAKIALPAKPITSIPNYNTEARRPGTPFMDESDEECNESEFPAADHTASNLDCGNKRKLPFLMQCISEIYRQDFDCGKEDIQTFVVKECALKHSVNVSMTDILHSFEKKLCKKLKVRNRLVSAIVASPFCTFHCEIDFNGPSPPSSRISDVSSASHGSSTMTSGGGTIESDFDLSSGLAPNASVGGKTFVSNSMYTVRIQEPIIVRSSCIMFELFGRDRFFKAKISPLSNQTKNGGIRKRYTKIIEEGVKFAGRTYHYLAGEGKDRSEGSAYFFATEDEYGLITPISTSEVRQALANFEVSTTAGITKAVEILPGKINARLMLGFSPTYPGITLIDHQVLVIDDICTPNGVVMTDGCGLISSSLLHSLPFAIHSGVPFCDRVLPENITSAHSNVPYMSAICPLPNTLQVRLSCKKGLFKGCLTVTTDLSLCPENCVVMRKSMLKVPGPPHITDNTPCTLFINKTFEKVSCLPSTSFTGIPPVMFTAPPINPWGAHFSVDLALLLCHLGMPMEIILAQAHKEIMEVENLTASRSAALDYLHRTIRRFEKKEYSEEDSSGVGSDDRALEEAHANFLLGNPLSPSSVHQTRDTSEGGKDAESWYQSTKYSAFANLAQNASQKALFFLLAGHELHEPHLCGYLRRIQEISLNRLKRLKFKIASSAFLVGTPDPFMSLAEDEVFVYIPLLDGDIRISPVLHDCNVLVTRYPLHHPGDLRKLRAVHNSALNSLVSGSSNPVIFFSTKGKRSRADMMGGGDFDGDEYCVIYNQSIVQAVNVVDPYTSTSYPSTSPTPISLKPHDDTKPASRDLLGLHLIGNLLHHANSNMVGLCSVSWAAFADRDPSCAEALLCDHFARLSLDAAKTGFDSSKIKIPPISSKPDWMSDKLPGVKDVFISESVVGIVHREVEKKISLFHKVGVPPRADEDVFTVINEGKTVFSMTDEINQRKGQKPWPLWLRWRNHYSNYKRGIATASNGNPGEAGEGEKIRALKDHYIEEFDRDSATLCLEKRFASLSPYTVRRILAAVVYHLTYENATEFNGSYRVSFCWEVCPAELHDNKRRSVALKMQQHEFDVLPSHYLRDMYNVVV